MGEPAKMDGQEVEIAGLLPANVMSSEMGQGNEVVGGAEAQFNKTMGFLVGELGLFGLLNIMNLATQYSGRIFEATQSLLGSRLTEMLRYQGADAGMIPFCLSFMGVAMYANFANHSGENVEMKKGAETATNWLALFGMVGSVYMAFEEFTRINLPAIPASESGDLAIMGFAQTLRGDPADVLVYSIPLIAGGIFAMKRIVDISRGKKVVG